MNVGLDVNVLIPAAQRKELSEEIALAIVYGGGAHGAGLLVWIE